MKMKKKAKPDQDMQLSGGQFHGKLQSAIRVPRSRGERESQK